MGLVKKTTILFPPKLHRHLAQLAGRRGLSLGQLVREACEGKYGPTPVEERLAAARELAGLSLPVASPRVMKRQSVPAPGEIVE